MRRTLLRPWLLLGAIVMSGPVLASTSVPAPVQLIYRGGPLIEHAQVRTLYWGANWKDSSLTSYFNSFFQALFADGRYMSNLAQYSAGGYQISNGIFRRQHDGRAVASSHRARRPDPRRDPRPDRC